MLQAQTRRARPFPDWRPFAWLAGVTMLLLLAAWSVPPMLDWGRFRTVIASIAAARLGRPVVIGGEISLRLLPEAVLTATDVTLADAGDGVSVRVAALRLQVATLPLLVGRVVVRDLVLSAPALHLPWSLPHSIGQSARPQVPHAFAARIENGRLRIGEAEVTGISASLHGGPAIGAEADSPDALPVSAFGAEGFATAGGRSWRFTAALGAPDADGVSAVDIAVQGQGAVGDTGGVIRGTLADGVVQGRLRVGGPDLSLLMPATAASWTAEAPFVADATRIEANAISLSLGGAPADGALVLHLDAQPGDAATGNAPNGEAPTADAPTRNASTGEAPTGEAPVPGVERRGAARGGAERGNAQPGNAEPGRGQPVDPQRRGAQHGDALVGRAKVGHAQPGGAQPGGAPARLEGHLHAASLDLNGWAALLRRSLRAAPGAGGVISMRVGLSAEGALLLDGRLDGLQATLVSDGTGFGLDHALAGLPGGATLAADHVVMTRTMDGQLAASGTATLHAPDLHATLGWLRKLAPPLADAIPGRVLRRADLTGLLTLQAGRGSATGLAGEIDGAPASGDVTVLLDGPTSLAATLRLADLPLDAWLGDAAWAGSLAGLAGHFTSAEADLHIHAAHAGWRGQLFDDLDMAVRTGAGGLRVERAQAGLDGARLSLAGQMAPDGRLSGVRFAADAEALDGVLARLPAAARVVPGLWHGHGALQVAADGPADAMTLQVRADASDLVLEADTVRDTLAGTGTTTITLRHPGAPRLFAELGLPQALGLPAGQARTASWLDSGALTFRAHFQDSPHHLAVQDFDLDAAALRVSGTLAADWSNAPPVLSGALAFDRLALPDTVPDLALPDLASPNLPRAGTPPDLPRAGTPPNLSHAGAPPDLSHAGAPPDLPHAGALSGLAQAASLTGWTSRLHVTATSVSVGLQDVASNAALDVTAGDGRVRLQSVSADWAGGRLLGQAEADLASPHFSTSLLVAGARFPDRLTGWPVDLVAGKADLGLVLDLPGTSLAKLSGTVRARITDAAITGFDLARITAAVPVRTKAGQAALRTALSQGSSTGLAGTVEATIAGDVLTLTAAKLASADGAAEFTGTANVADMGRTTGMAEAGGAAGPARRTVDGHIRLSPALLGSAAFRLTLRGPLQAPLLLADRTAAGKPGQPDPGKPGQSGQLKSGRSGQPKSGSPNARQLKSGQFSPGQPTPGQPGGTRPPSGPKPPSAAGTPG